MSWWIVNTVLSVQVIIMYFMFVNVRAALRIIASLREWIVPLPAEMADTQQRISQKLFVAQTAILDLVKQAKFVTIPMLLVVVANVFNHPIVYVPFWAGIGFTLEIVYRMFVIIQMGEDINNETQDAEEEFGNLGLIKIIQESQAKNA